MPDTVTAPSPTAADPKQTAANLAAAVQNKANGKAAGTPPSAADQPPAAPPADPNAGKEKYVVGGKEVWLTPDQARAYVQKGIAFEPRMDQLARLQQEMIQVQRALINDPIGVLKNIAQQKNIPIESLYERILDGDWPDSVKEVIGKKFYRNAVEPLKLTPEQMKARQDSEWRQKREAEDKAAQERAIINENQRKVKQAMGQLSAFINEAMKESGLPSNDTPLGTEMARMVADTMRVARLNRQDITPKQAIEFVKQKIKSVQAAYYDNLEADALVKELGEKNAAKVKKYFLKLAQDAGAKPPAVPNGKPAVRSGERKVMTPDEFRDYLEERKKNG